MANCQGVGDGAACQGVSDGAEAGVEASGRKLEETHVDVGSISNLQRSVRTAMGTASSQGDKLNELVRDVMPKLRVAYL